jgi:serine/threonine protein kinase
MPISFKQKCSNHSSYPTEHLDAQAAKGKVRRYFSPAKNALLPRCFKHADDSIDSASPSVSPATSVLIPRSNSVLTDVTVQLERRSIQDVPEPERESVDMSTLQIDKKIGEGKSANVHRAELTCADGSKILCATKNIQSYSDELAHAAAYEELSIAHNLNNENVIKTYGFHGEKISIVMELAVTDIRKMLIRIGSGSLPEMDSTAIAKAILKQVINGLFYLFKKRVAHYDLHPGNCFLKEGGTIVLADFGFAGHVPKSQYSLTNPADPIRARPSLNDPQKPRLQLKNNPFLLPYKLVTLANTDLTAVDINLINRMYYFDRKEYSEAVPGKHYPVEQNTLDIDDQRAMRETFITLWDHSQKWDCLSNLELEAKLKQYMPDIFEK